MDATDAFIPTMDVTGHFAGGIRLPHVASEVRGRTAGAPLGQHTPLKPQELDPFHAFAFPGGTFTRFSDEDLLARYSSRQQYLSRVRRAADDLAGRSPVRRN